MIPYLKEFEILNFLPIVNLKIDDTSKNLYFCAEHGGGKSTLCDLIVFSLLREEIDNRGREYFHARTRYWETRLTLEDLNKLFRVLYQVTELDNHPFFTDEKYNRVVMKCLKDVMVDEKAQEQINHLKKETSDLNTEIRNKKKEIEDLLSSRPLLESFPDKKKTLELKKIELQKTLKEIEFTEEKIVELESKQKINDQSIADFNLKIRELSNKITGFNFQIDNLNQRIDRIDNNIASYQNLYYTVKEEIENSPLCKLCGNNVLKEWHRESEGSCPVCGLSLPQKDISTRIEESIRIQKNEFMKRRKGLEREIRDKEIEKDNFDKELGKYEKGLKKEIKIRNELRELNKIQINKIKSLEKEQGQIQKENDLINTYVARDVKEEFAKLGEEQEELEKKHEIKSTKLNELKQNSNRFSEFLDKVELEWEELYKKYLGESMSINLQDQKIICDEQELHFSIILDILSSLIP